MNENTTEFTHSTRAILGLVESRVEDYRIRPREVTDDRIRMQVIMRIGGEYGTYYLRAETVYGGANAGHCVQLEAQGGDVVDTFEIEESANPDGAFAATQRLCETYVSRVEDWYARAVAADEAGETA